ncbi:MAG: alpha/beta hydrolase [Chloroflexi bacterium]|nr:alpha/beta hydrolase [Chloroflexota bacterium]MBI3339524.1 alpha/beta hydrolase [Chloroflexota bacterium]
MKKIKVNGFDLAFERNGRGMPLVLIHGYPLDHTIWNESAPLLEKDFDLILPDLRGFGQSGTVAEPYSMADLASDIVGLLDQLELDKAFVAGHSMGGYVALAFARAYPQRLAGLGMISSQVSDDPPDRKEGRYKTAADVAEKGAGLVADAMAPKLSADAHVQLFVRDLIGRQKAAGVIGALKAMAERPDSADLLKKLKVPAVIVHGDADALIPVERGREMKAAIPGAYYAELPGVGHMPMTESPKAVAAALKLFVKRNSAGQE